ncbi:GNAT family N-acetyltransferase [Nocardioides caldifontis]|uniref:GNAT family N-acetyltransferase n=1 Tax=Nocardioides caldifontis TaxID=2588938 RepID=UPI001EF049DA|nr:GNAT family protein [Nocardioides caldifontis]
MSLTTGAVRWQDLRLRHGAVVLRPLVRRDRRAWQETRRRNAAWLAPWEATRPPGDPLAPLSFGGMVRDLRRQARQGRALPLALTVDGEFAGQVTVSNVVGGSARFASVGYWIDRKHAGQGHMPVAVALTIDHCFRGMGLHRVEIAIRPENAASLRVVEKLGLQEIGYAPRYLHIDGAWRDHRLFAVTVEEVPGGLLRRLVGR